MIPARKVLSSCIAGLCMASPLGCAWQPAGSQTAAARLSMLKQDMVLKQIAAYLQIDESPQVSPTCDGDESPRVSLEKPVDSRDKAHQLRQMIAASGWTRPEVVTEKGLIFEDATKDLPSWKASLGITLSPSSTIVVLYPSPYSTCSGWRSVIAKSN